MANAFSVPNSSSSGSANLSAIAGDNQIPYSSAHMATNTDALTTGDLQLGDAGEMSQLAEFAVEFWFMSNGGLASATNTIAQGPESTDVGFVEWFIGLTVGNAFTFTVRTNASTNVTANGATAIVAGQFYHLVCTCQGGNARVYVNGVQDGTSASWGASTVQAFRGVAGSADFKLRQTVATLNYYFDEVATYRTGLTAARVLEHYNAGVNRGWTQQLSGARIGSILDTVTSHAPRALQAGVRNIIPRYMSGQSPLSEVQLTVEAEDVDSAFFAAKDGTLTFLADGCRSASPYNTSQVTLGDGGGAEIPYKDFTMDYSESFLINEWNVTRTPYRVSVPVTQTSTDATSVSRYFKRSQSLSDVPVIQDSDCATIATELLAKYKDPMQRVTSVTMQASAPDTTAAGLARDLADRITVKRRPPGGGSPISQDVFIEKIDISGSNDGAPWVFNWGVSPQ